MAESRVPNAYSPVRVVDDDRRGELEPTIALCLSGGGFRAALFHLGALWRLNELALLPRLARISSVSGGSISAGVLGAAWSRLRWEDERAVDFAALVVDPIVEMARHDIGNEAFFKGLLLPGSRADWLVRKYDEHLFAHATLQSLPDAPRFLFNATNLETGAIFRFSKARASDHRVGAIDNPEFSLATAVGASSAFPPTLSPLELELAPGQMQRLPQADLHREPLTRRALLTDGGVYDNLGLETVWRRCRTVLVSDAVLGVEAEASPGDGVVWPNRRVLEVIQHGVTRVRKSQLIDAFKRADDPHDGTYWGIGSDIRNYGLNDALPCPVAATLDLARTPTRLGPTPHSRSLALINWGYAITDAAIRKHVVPGARAPRAFPYPDIGVDGGEH
jgi:NTE family protein